MPQSPSNISLIDTHVSPCNEPYLSICNSVEPKNHFLDKQRGTLLLSAWTVQMKYVLHVIYSTQTAAGGRPQVTRQKVSGATHMKTIIKSLFGSHGMPGSSISTYLSKTPFAQDEQQAEVGELHFGQVMGQWIDFSSSSHLVHGGSTPSLFCHCGSSELFYQL